MLRSSGARRAAAAGAGAALERALRWSGPAAATPAAGRLRPEPGPCC